MKVNFNSQTALSLAIKQVEKHYKGKYVNALPEWAMISADPDIVAVITLYGVEGIAIAKQGVDFEVDFKDSTSVNHYADFINNQMDITLDVLGYVVYFDKRIFIKKDPMYKKELSDNQIAEMYMYNNLGKELEISILYLNKSHEPFDDLESLSKGD